MTDLLSLASLAFLNSTNDLVLVLDLQDRLVFHNPQAEKFLGSTCLHSGQKLEELLPGWDTFLQSYRNGEVSGETCVMTGKDSTFFVFWVTSVLEESGTPAGTLLRFHNINRFKRSEGALQIEQSLRLLAENAGDVIWIIDIRGHFSYISPSVERLRGYTPEEVLQQDFTATLTPESAIIATTSLQNLILNTRNAPPLEERFELEQYCKDGTSVWTEVIANAMFDPRGELLGILGVSRNINQRRRVEQSLRDSEERFRLMVEVAPVPLALIRFSDNSLIYFNRQAEKVFGLSTAEAREKPTADFFANTLERRIILKQLLKNGAIYDVEVPLVRSNGQKFWGQVSGVMTTYLGEATFMVVVIDISGRKQAEEERRRAVQIAEALQRAGVVINASLDFHETLDRVLEQIAGVIHFDVASILLRDGDWAVITALRGYADPDSLIGERFSLSGETPNQLVLQHSCPVIVDDIQTLYPSFDRPHSAKNLSWMGIPLFSKNEIVGFLNLDSFERAHFSAEDQRTAEAFANQVSIALENAHLYGEAQQHLQRQAILNEVIHAVISKLNQGELLDVIYQQVNRFMDAVFFLIASYEEGSDEWNTLYLHKDEKKLDNQIYQVSQGFGGYILLTRQPLFLRNSNEILEFVRKTGRESLVSLPKSIMLVPLIVSERLIGLMGAQNDLKDEAYSTDDYALFNSIAAQVAIALENARLFARMEHLAITDELTGLFNRRHFFSLAEKEFERARRYNDQLSVIMLDVDLFKAVNDTYGHLAGDEVLAFLARQTADTLRTIDLVGRYGGEEFVILLPESGLADACIAAERLRSHIDAHDAQTRAGTIHITVSIGVAAYIPGKDTLDSMLDRADQALYEAKHRGRNQIGFLKE